MITTSAPLRIDGNAGAELNFTTSAAQTATALPEGIYAVTPSVDCFIKVAATANNVTTVTGLKVFQDSMVLIWVPSGMRLGAIGGGAGVLKYHKVTQ